MRKLAARSDVLIENFKVGGLAKFGLDYKSLAAENPRLIYCSVTGFGQDGPYAPRAGYDLMAQGMGGIMGITGTPDGEPMRAGVPVADMLDRRLFGARRSWRRSRSASAPARGCYIDTALVDTQVGVLANQALNFLVSGDVPQRIGNAHATIVPYQVFPVADGHIIIACGNDSQFARLCGVLGEPALAEEPRISTNAGRGWRTARELIAQAVGADAEIHPRRPLGEARSRRRARQARSTISAEVFADPQVEHRGMRIDPPSAAAKGGTIPGVRTPIMIDGAPMAAERPSPRLGEHTDEILREIGEK